MRAWDVYSYILVVYHNGCGCVGAWVRGCVGVWVWSWAWVGVEYVAMSRPAEPRAPGVCFSSLADSPLFQQGLRTTPGTCKADYS